MPIAIITAEDYEPYVGEDFVLPGEDGTPALHFTLIKVQRGPQQMPGTTRWPFNLSFRTATQNVYPQGMYRLTHPSFEYQDIFLVPVGQSETGTEYNAYYN